MEYLRKNLVNNETKHTGIISNDMVNISWGRGNLKVNKKIYKIELT